MGPAQGFSIGKTLECQLSSSAVIWGAKGSHPRVQRTGREDQTWFHADISGGQCGGLSRAGGRGAGALEEWERWERGHAGRISTGA